MLRAKNMTEAWEMAAQIFPTDYEKDEESSKAAGYPIYRSATEGRFYDYICDLNTRLEINLADGNRTINILVGQTAMEQKAETGEIQKKVEAGKAAKELGKTASLLFNPEQYMRITMVVDGSKWNCNETERKVYDGLKRGDSWLIGDLIASYCETNEIRWETITDIKCNHYEHGKNGENGGHYVVAGYVRKRVEGGLQNEV